MNDSFSTASKPDIVVRDAATVILAREENSKIEVCMLERNLKSDFVGGAYVFPGGAVDAGDDSPELEWFSPHFTSSEANRALGVESGGLSFFVAAIRESLEEAGLFMASFKGDDELLSTLDLQVRDNFNVYREELNSKRKTFIEILKSNNISIRPDKLFFFLADG